MDETKLEEFNKVPVCYCKNCLSLRIMILDEQQDFCDTCGGMDIGTTDIDTWDKMYQEKYKHKFVENGKKHSFYRWAGPTE